MRPRWASLPAHVCLSAVVLCWSVGLCGEATRALIWLLGNPIRSCPGRIEYPRLRSAACKAGHWSGVISCSSLSLVPRLARITNQDRKGGERRRPRLHSSHKIFCWGACQTRSAVTSQHGAGDRVALGICVRAHEGLRQAKSIDKPRWQATGAVGHKRPVHSIGEIQHYARRVPAERSA